MFASFSKGFRSRGPALVRAVLVAITLGLSPVALSVWPAQPALAADLAQAKASGLVGEKPDGLLGLVKADVPADVVAMVKDINARRRAEYEKIAKETGTSPDAVGAVTFEKLFKSGKPGYYLVNDQWIEQ
jgi:uncharacterized protein YdbL (DUF1318 family)